MRRDTNVSQFLLFFSYNFLNKTIQSYLVLRFFFFFLNVCLKSSVSICLISISNVVRLKHCFCYCGDSQDKFWGKLGELMENQKDVPLKHSSVHVAEVPFLLFLYSFLISKNICTKYILAENVLHPSWGIKQWY